MKEQSMRDEGEVEKIIFSLVRGIQLGCFLSDFTLEYIRQRTEYRYRLPLPFQVSSNM